MAGLKKTRAAAARRPTPDPRTRPPEAAAQSVYRPSTPERARKMKTRHAHVLGMGFLEVVGADDLPKPPGGHPRGNCVPPVPAHVLADGSAHLLQPPQGGRPMIFRWVAAERAWERAGGKRLAFTVDYMGAWGWQYVRPAEVS